MSTTCKTIITAALARRTANDTSLYTDSELVGVIDRSIQHVYSLVGRTNPQYFGKSASVTPNGSAWIWPPDALFIDRVESAGGGGNKKLTVAGKEVHRTPSHHKDAEAAPAIYDYGRASYSVGRTDASNPDPSALADGDTLKFFYPKRHPSLDGSLPTDHETNTLDATWLDHYNDLLVIPVSRYLALKDGRDANEIAALDAEYAKLEALLVQEVQMTAYGVRAQFAQTPMLSSPSVQVRTR